MKMFFTTELLLLGGALIFCTPLYGSEAEESSSYLTGGIGLEQLTYNEQIPDIELTSTDTNLTNWVLFLEGRRAWDNFFIGAKGYIPLSTDEAQEYWTREGEFEQTNSLTYRWTRIDAHVGYFLHKLLNPYVGVNWGYSEQERSNFANISIPGIFAETATEEVYSFSALLGIQGNIPIVSKLSFTYFAEYLLPFYSNTTNSSLPGWEASNIDGYSYSLTGCLNYAFSETLTASLQMSGGSQHWEGSDWIPINGSSAKWPENDTDFISGYISIYKYF
jgi:hypothetical protein